MTVHLEAAQIRTFIRRLSQESGVRIPSQRLWRLFTETFPGLTGRPDQRSWFLSALESAAEQGAIRLPSSRGERWDRSLEPAVPTSVDRVTEREEQPERTWQDFPWHPALSWVAGLNRLDEHQETFLVRVHRGLVKGWFLDPAPAKYRSLQLCGDEKRLEELAHTTLFDAGRLSLEMLGCIRDATPVAWERVGPEGDTLVFENAGPFQVARRVLAELDDPPYGLLCYGAGRAFEQSVAYLRTIDAEIESLRYVGDLDRPGLRTAGRAAAAAMRAELPPLEAAAELHRAMLEAAVAFGHPDGWPYGIRERESTDRELVEFLARDLRTPVLEMLARGHRVPEEVLGPQELREIWDGGGS